jgi:hypothetical protein
MELTDIGLSRSSLHWVAWRVSQNGGAVSRSSHIDDR